MHTFTGMKKNKPHTKRNAFEHFATIATHATGSTAAFISAIAIIVLWAGSGFIFDYSDTWQLVINTGTTIITFLMVFLIQKTQNKDSLAIHIKLNELLASIETASNRIVDVEDITEDELRVLQKYYQKLAELSKKELNLQVSHSIEEAMSKHEQKIETINPSHFGGNKKAATSVKKSAAHKSEHKGDKAT